MPPPPIPVAPTITPASGPSGVTSSTSVSLDSGPDITSSKGSRFKNTGFRPIGQNSAVKKFFPADDDDVGVASDHHTQTSSAPSVPRPEESVREQQDTVKSKHQRERDGSTKSSSRRHEHPGVPSPSHQRSRVLQVDVQTPKDSRNEPWPSPTWQPQVPDRECNEVTRPLSPTGGSPGELYTIISQVGEGTFGKVYKARNTVTKVHVALKRIRMEAERDGFPVTAMREIKLLQSLRHGNVVRLYEMMVSNG